MLKHRLHLAANGEKEKDERLNLRELSQQLTVDVFWSASNIFCTFELIIAYEIKKIVVRNIKTQSRLKQN